MRKHVKALGFAWGIGQAIILTTATHVATACTWSSACQGVGLCDPPARPPVLVDVVCDHSAGSSCSVPSLRRSLAAILEPASGRPGSRVRLWSLGETYAGTKIVGERIVPAPKGRSERARKTHAREWAAESLEVLFSGAGTLQDRPTRTPLFEGIAKVALADDYGLPRRLVIISDARETAAMNLECKLPALAKVRAVLRAKDLLQPGSLSDVEVAFTFVDGDWPRGRCRTNPVNDQAVRRIWREVLTETGASTVVFRTGAISLGQDGHLDLGKTEVRDEQ